MRVTENTLKTYIERWDDPGGPYPNGAASCALPSYDFVADVTGYLTVHITTVELQAWGDESSGKADILDYIYTSSRELNGELPSGVTSVKLWHLDKVTAATDGWLVQLSVHEFESSEVEYDDEPDYDPAEWGDSD